MATVRSHARINCPADDPQLRRFQYRITSGMPVEQHLGTVGVLDDGDSCMVVYSTEIRPDSMAGPMEPVIAEGVQGLTEYCENPCENLYDLDGKPVTLSSLWSDRPVVIEFGSISCPIFVEKLDRMQRMAQDFAGSADFYVVYVREAHPGRNYPPHQELGRKLRHAGDLQRLERVSRPILVDGVESAMHRDYGALPNAVYVIGTDGIISFRADWNDPSRLERHLRTLIAQSGRAGKIRPEQLVDNFQRPRPGLLRQAYRVLRRAGTPALRDFLRQAPTMLRARLRLWYSRRHPGAA